MISAHYLVQKQPEMVRLLRRYVPLDQAEDIVQDAIVSLLTYPNTLNRLAAEPRADKTIGHLFYKVCWRILGRKMAEQKEEFALYHEDAREVKQRNKRPLPPLWEILGDSRLSARTCAVLQEYYQEGLTFQELAERHGVSFQRISQLLHAAVEKLREDWK